jgi:DNA-binding GntR family transcriptional regulator
MHGLIPDGAELSQVQLATKYGVSRIPIREALRRLQAESLVIATPYHPFVVRKVTVAQVLELVDVRATLEDFALSRREPLSAKTIAELRALNQKMVRGREHAAFLATDREFHQLVAGPGTMTAEILDDVRKKVHRYLSSVGNGKPRLSATEEHAKIIDALEAQDMVLARTLLQEHVTASRGFIASKLTADEPISATSAGGQ